LGRGALGAAFEPYFAEHASIGTGADARGPDLWGCEEGRLWRARLVLDDPAGFREWAILTAVDLDASDRLGEAVLRPSPSIGPANVRGWP